MTKAVFVSLGFVLILAGTCSLPAQTNTSSAANIAVTQAILRQANTIVLRQKLIQARTAMTQGHVEVAAKLYEDAYALVQKIGSGIPAETEQTISGLVAARYELAREAQREGRLHEADMQISRALKVQPQNAAAIAFKKHNDRLIAAQRGKVPDEATQQQVPMIKNKKTEANTLVQDGKLLYEMGEFEDAQAKLERALKLDPLNEGAFYYMNLVKQGLYARNQRTHTIDNENRIVQVSKAWAAPKNLGLPVPNPYATNTLIHTSPGREEIMRKLNSIRLEKVSYDGLPLSEVIRDLSDKAKLRDPDKTGINFLINPNVDYSTSQTTTTSTGGGGASSAGGELGANIASQINPATGLPAAPQSSSGGSAPFDINSVIIRINPPLYNVRLADVLDAIVQVADHPIKYSILNYAVVFSAKGPESPQLYSRTFKVDPNTFVQGLESVGSLVFVNTSSSSGNGGGGGGSSGGAGGTGGQNNEVGLVAVVNAAPGSGNRSSGAGGGGGGGGGGANGQTGNGGLNFVTVTNNMVNVSATARNFFDTLGVNLDPPKSIFFNDRLGLLFVRATMQDLDTIESAIEALNQVAPMVHMKARFIQVEQDDNKGLGFDWYLGQYNLGGGVAAQGGNAGSVSVTPSAANPGGTFPGNLFNATTVASGVQSLTSGLNNGSLPAIASLTGILTNPNFQVVLHALEQRTGFEELAEPEVTTLSGRQTEMRATEIISVITSFNFTQGAAASLGGVGVGGTTP